ncbi:unnamed protein product [Caenorhabditis brenneri]
MIIPIFSFLISVFLRAEGYLVPSTIEWKRIPTLSPRTFRISYKNIKLNLGTVFMIETKISERMDIYLQSDLEKSDIPLHISVRPEKEEAIVFNSFVRNAWDFEERRRIPFSFNSVMSLRIKIEESRFLIRIGENWFKSFEHRVPFKLIEQLYIVGFKDIPLLEVTDNEGIEL